MLSPVVIFTPVVSVSVPAPPSIVSSISKSFAVMIVSLPAPPSICSAPVSVNVI